MRTVFVVVLDVCARHNQHVAFSEDQDSIETFAAQGADPSFGEQAAQDEPNERAGDRRNLDERGSSELAER